MNRCVGMKNFVLFHSIVIVVLSEAVSASQSRLLLRDESFDTVLLIKERMLIDRRPLDTSAVAVRLDGDADVDPILLERFLLPLSNAEALDDDFVTSS